MKRYVRAIFGGLLAILAAFGWAVAVSFFITMKYGLFISGLRVGAPLWVLLFLIFAVGFYFSFRSAYRSNNPN